MEGTEDLPNKWSKRLLAFNTTAIPVENLYKYEEERYGTTPCRFLYFKNDKEHKLGTTPLPNGRIQVYRQVDPQRHLSYEGGSSIQYIPVGQKAEVNLGNVRNVVVKPKLMRFRIENITFSWNGGISGYDKVEDWEIEVRNRRSIPVRIEITRNYHTPHWDISQKLPPQVKWEKIDLDTGRYTLTLQPNSTITIPYTLRRYTGDRARRH
ncbi:MAG: hypothetical protein D6820_12215 [Lentisphaerae bacterium]|nr:MAG: hypothetical protein D6820_12215 [Lentisphaerota bacterium]